ncbi:periplasmic heavy metal sensor [Coralloluteibacterium thermophilus]|uniref:Signaling pathway modulator ZraP n=1 Tax=Coralloluteibacterium thermophilum TaxID=2707049 RepID=A0ABV9NJ63_9GAMM
MTALPRPWRIALVVSLLVNVLLAAALATFALRSPEEPPRTRGGGLAGMPHPRALAEAFGEERRVLLHEIWDTHRETMRPRWRAMHAARQDISNALRAQPFVRADLDAAFARLRAADAEMAETAQAALGDFAERLDDAERARLADMLEPPPHRGDGKSRAR